MLNNINLCGRVCSSPELKVTPNGKYVTSFTIAVDRDFQSGGEKETDFIPIVLWGTTAQFAVKYFPKGKMMLVNGRLQVRKYTTQNGEKRSITEVIGNNIYFAGDKSKDGNYNSFKEISIPEVNNSFKEINIEVEDEDGDLPF